MKKAEISYSDGNGKVFLTLPNECTDFPLDSMRLYFTDNILLLQSKYEGLKRKYLILKGPILYSEALFSTLIFIPVTSGYQGDPLY